MTENPYTPGAAHAPPYLAGRDAERGEFSRLLKQTRILENLVLTGIRGIGKTVLLREAFRKDAVENGWLWVGSDISEEVSAGEGNLARRLFADLNTYSGDWECTADRRNPLGFTGAAERKPIFFDYQSMMLLFEQEPGLTSDKIKRVLLIAWGLMQKHMPQKKGIIFAWDEAHNLADRRADKQYSLSVLLDVFNSLQSQGAPFMLALAGLPTLFPNLVESRAYTERMFRVVTLDNLSAGDSYQAIMKPLKKAPAKKFFEAIGEKTLYQLTKGYPYFIQFWGRELYDYLAAGVDMSAKDRYAGIVRRIFKKLDADFFEGRWAKLTDRQRDLLRIIAFLENSNAEFTVQEIVNASKGSGDAFGGSHVNQMLTSLYEKGMVFKTRHGKYVLVVPLLDEYIRRRLNEEKARTP
ncbi:MAG: ATP-binding protein [Gammaproteobacteria bacterium]